MKLTIALVIFICSLNLTGQTAQDFINSCVKEEHKKGVKNIILSAKLCSACRGEVTYEGFIFIKDTTEIYKVRYLLYVHRPKNVKVLKDKIFIDNNIKSIFKITETYHDSILWQVKNIEGLLVDTIIENGEKKYEKFSSHGEMRYLKIYYNDKLTASIENIINLNDIFFRAYYYWLLNSIINNYINDFLRSKIESNKK